MTVRFTKDHEWVRLEGTEATVGITAYAAEQLGDVVFVELPPAGKEVAQGGEMAVVESAKAASDVYAPLAGVVLAVNVALNDAPQLVNESPQGEGWFCRLRFSALEEFDALMDEAAYQDFIARL
jgi:glycine cleavage system H protein